MFFVIPALVLGFLFIPATSWNFSGYELKHQRMVYHGISSRCFFFDWKKKSISKDSATYQLLSDPTILSGNPKISASVVDHQKRAVYDRCLGFALTFPSDNILASFTKDGVTDELLECKSHRVNGLRVYNSIDSCYRALKRHPEGVIRSPEELIRGILPGSWNELVLRGKSSVGSVRVAAIVIGCNKEADFSHLRGGELKMAIQSCFETDKQDHLIDLIVDRVAEGYPLVAMNFSRFPEKD